MRAKSRKFPWHVVTHDADSHGLALNLCESGASVALVVPADVWTLVLGRTAGELRLFPRPSDAPVRAARAAHFPHLTLVAATTTLLTTAPSGGSFRAAGAIDDAGDRLYGPEPWAPLDLPEPAAALGLLR